MSLDGWIARGVPEEVADVAIQWVARLDSNEISDADRAAFFAWLDASPINRWAYNDISESWTKLSTLNEMGHRVDRAKVLQFPQKVSPATVSGSVSGLVSTKVHQSSWPAIAAMSLMVVGLVLSLSLGTASNQRFTAEQLQVDELQDGSLLTLNSDSVVTSHFSARTREIWLHEGDLIIQVSHDERPLLVHAGNASITALGTEFMVSKTALGVDVIVLEGAVQMTGAAAALDSWWEFDRDSFFSGQPNSLLLAAGEGGAYQNTTGLLEPIENIEVSARTSWRDGKLTFANTPLEDAIEQVMRHSDIRIHLKTPELSQLRISGSFKSGDSQAFLSALADQLPVDVMRYSSRWIVLRASL